MESASVSSTTQSGLLRAESLQLLVSPSSDAKALGAYYTDAQIADFLARWAVRSPKDTVIDPSFGGGVFLRSACKRLLAFGGSPEAQVFGVEIDGEVHGRITDKLADEFSLRQKNLLLADFFELKASAVKPFDVVIGNPPFIRYQRFSGDSRRMALAHCLAAGVRLPELCSSWAPFVVHSIAMLKDGGRLAMVLPMEVAHAKYARPVLEHIRQSFRTATFLTFRKKLFPDLNEDTLLLLAEDKGGGPGRFSLRDFAHAGLLSDVSTIGVRPLGRVRALPAESVASGKSRLIEYLIPPKARRLYQQLRDFAQVQRLANFADVGIGYVTGANDFFHLTPEEARTRRIPDEFLKRAVRRGRALEGLRFTATDWSQATSDGDGGFLLHIPKERPLPASVRDYVRWGESQKVDEAYKCRSRSPWFCVPHVHKPDAFLTYMSGTTPRLVVNSAGVFAPNTLHVVRVHPLSALSSDMVATLWHTSLTRLSVELEGHALGGGMLKLEPTEAGNVLVAVPAVTTTYPQLGKLGGELDRSLRAGDRPAAQKMVDRAVLQDLLGLSKSDCKLLESAADVLRGRRYGVPNRGTA